MLVCHQNVSVGLGLWFDDNVSQYIMTVASKVVKDCMVRRRRWHRQQQQQPFYGPLSGTTRVSRYQKKHSPTHHPDHHPIFISFFHLQRSIASSLFKLRAWQSFCTTSLHVLFGLPLGLEPSTWYSIHFLYGGNWKRKHATILHSFLSQLAMIWSDNKYGNLVRLPTATFNSQEHGKKQRQCNMLCAYEFTYTEKTALTP